MPRQMVEEDSFAESKALISADARRLDEILESVVLRLCVAPEGGTPVPGAPTYVILTAAFPGAPTLSIEYRFDDEHVFLLWVELY